jgi:hypothetical protein
VQVKPAAVLPPYGREDGIARWSRIYFVALPPKQLALAVGSSHGLFFGCC